MRLGSRSLCQAGTFSVRVGATHIAPQVSSGNLSTPSFPGSTVDVGSASALTGGLNYKSFLKTTTHLSTGQSIHIKLNPNVFAMGIGYRF